MPEIVGVRFRNQGKVYYFDPDNIVLREEDKVIVETSRGMECGDVVEANRFILDSEWDQPLKKVIRLATTADIEQIRENRRKEREAVAICESKVEEHKLDMRLIRAEYTFDRSKLLIYFTADGRVDFRQLVRDLAAIFRTRIELRQIGVRDEAKMLGGIGICGREFCCSSFLNNFEPVSIKMAKTQGLSLNPTKISGACGRLMCCLNYEQNVYEELTKQTPRVGTFVSTSSGDGKITDVTMLTGMLKVLIAGEDGTYSIEEFHKDEVKVLENPRNKR